MKGRLAIGLPKEETGEPGSRKQGSMVSVKSREAGPVTGRPRLNRFRVWGIPHLLDEALEQPADGGGQNGGEQRRHPSARRRYRHDGLEGASPLGLPAPDPGDGAGPLMLS